jgi:hypothetical protein
MSSGNIRHSLARTDSEKDLGIILTNNLKFDAQANAAAAKASKTLGQIKRTFRYWTKGSFRTIFTAFVRPHLEYAIQAWSPQFKKDIITLEKIQRRATKLVRSVRHLSYSERLRKLNMISLEERRTRGDLIQFFKFYSGFNSISWIKEPSKANFLMQTGPSAGLKRSHFEMKRPPITNCCQREHFFINRTIPIWNSLPPQIIEADSINQFKNRLDKYYDQQRTISS